MVKNIHEIRDPIHVFIKLSSQERTVVDSLPFQRLRHIHQLALTSLIYPGATHKRFEHSLGVMELASRVYDTITEPSHLPPAAVAERLPQLADPQQVGYWRAVLRMAALGHDLGHLPFSHAAEKQLLPDGVDHESLTAEIISGPLMEPLWLAMTPPLRKDDVVKLAVGEKAPAGTKFSDWEAMLGEIITSDVFGVDRMDYLLRDSYSAGVAYGKFDHYRLIDTMRILPPVPEPGNDASSEPTLGVEEGGLHSAEALLLARYYMYSQVYFHPVRRIYDRHLQDYLTASLPGGMFPTAPEELMGWTDNEVFTALRLAANDDTLPGHRSAKAIVGREHYKEVFRLAPGEPSEVVVILEEALKSEFGVDSVRVDLYSQKSGTLDFPVQMDDGTVVSARAASKVLADLPIIKVGLVYIDPPNYTAAIEYVRTNRDGIIAKALEEE